MTFQRIGDIAARLTANPGNLVAAANEAPRKGAEPEGPAQLTNREEHPSPARRIMGRPVLLLVEGNREGRTAFAAKYERPQRPAVRLSLVLITGGANVPSDVLKRAHAASVAS